MAADYGQMARDLDRFYNLEDKVVVFVGAGTKQLLDVSRKPKRTIAIDQSAEALQQLEQQVEAQHLERVAGQGLSAGAAGSGAGGALCRCVQHRNSDVLRVDVTVVAVRRVSKSAGRSRFVIPSSQVRELGTTIAVVD